MLKSAKKPAGPEAANAAALDKIAQVAEAHADAPGSMRFHADLHFWQVDDAEVDDGKLRLHRREYIQVPVEKEEKFLKYSMENGLMAKKMEGGSRQRLIAFCKKNELPVPEGGVGEVLERGHVEYMVHQWKDVDVSPTLLSKHGKCTLPGLKEGAVVCVGIEKATVRKEVACGGALGHMCTEMKDVTVSHRRIVAIVPPSMYDACEISVDLDKHNSESSWEDRDDIAWFI